MLYSIMLLSVERSNFIASVFSELTVSKCLSKAITCKGKSIEGLNVDTIARD
jgi:hypothetical protein